MMKKHSVAADVTSHTKIEVELIRAALSYVRVVPNGEILEKKAESIKL